MRTVIIRYRVKPEQAARNEELVRAVYEELERDRPGGLNYGTFKAPDGVSFVHFASVRTADGHNPLTDVAAFRAFTEGIAERCDEPPVTTELDEVGSYRLFG
jgi:hypothetical protein